jgi:CHASE3 domain sensor protein
MIRKATLKIGVPVLLVCMALNAYLAVDHLRQMWKMDARTLVSSEMQASISGLLADLTDMETSQRGYLLRATNRTCNRTPVRRTESESILPTSECSLLLGRRANNQ